MELAYPSRRLAALSRQERRDVGPQPTIPDVVSADAFRGLVVHFEHEESTRRAEAHRGASEKRHQEARELLKARLSEETWRHMLDELRSAAQKGEQEHLILRFPSELCTDHGRAVNAPDPSWPATLRGLAAQVYLRWKRELRSRGFHLQARVIDFPEGMPGNIGLYLSWSE